METLTHTSAAGVVTRFLTNTYNGNGQLYSVHDSATGKTLYAVYDSLGRLVSADNGDVRVVYTYNAYNQLTGYRFSSSVLGDGTESYTYDTDSTNSRSDGMLVEMGMVTGHTIAYTYDSLQRTTQRHINSGKTGGGMWECFIFWDGSEAGTTTTRVHTKENWLNNSVRTNFFFFEYDKNGNITKETRHNFTVPSSSSQAQNTANKDISTTHYTYDALGQLTKVVHNDDWEEIYEYDDAGNITSFNNGNGIDLELFYDDPQWEDLLTKVGNNTITYDAIGNPTSYYDGSAMVWAEGRRLQSISKDGQTYSYLYNADGLRIQKTNPDGSYIKYQLFNGQYLGEIHYNAQNQPQKYIRYTYDEVGSITGIGVRNDLNSEWTEYYFETNLQGDVIAVYTAANNSQTGLPELVASYTYDAWGNVLSATGSLADLNPFRYRGYYYDSETQFYYLQSRYYNPEIGRFINADGFASTGQGFLGHNMFAYCNNNPVLFVDSKGTRPVVGADPFDPKEEGYKESFEYMAALSRASYYQNEAIRLKTCPNALNHDGSNTSTYANESDMSVIARMLYGEDGTSAEAHMWLLQCRLTSGDSYGGNNFRTLILAYNQFYAMGEDRALDPASHFNKLGERERWDHCVDVAYAYITGGITAVPKPSETFYYTWSHAYSDSIATQYPNGVHIGGTWFYNK